MRSLLMAVSLLFIGHIGVSQEGIVIKSVFFGGGSWYVDQEQTVELSNFIENFPNIDSYTITVISHTDNIGGIEYNQWLSEKRSTSVVEQLMLNDIELDHIHIEDHGQRNPVYDNLSWNGRFRNRRVDIILEPLAM